jgi:hypothetical protein
MAARARGADHASLILRSERRLQKGAVAEPMHQGVGVSLDESVPCSPFTVIFEHHKKILSHGTHEDNLGKTPNKSQQHRSSDFAA